MHRLPIVWFAALAAPLAAQQTSGGPPIPEQDCYDVRQYRLTLTVDPDAHRIDGTLQMRADVAAGTSRIALDLDAPLTVTSVTVPGHDATVKRDGLRILIDFTPPATAGEAMEFTLAYGGVPREAPSPPWQGGFTWATTKDGAPWIATSCQGEGADLWWPCKDRPDDEPDTMDLRITVPKGLVCASNGVLVADRKVDTGRHEFHWRVANPIANYVVALNIAPYEVIRTTYTCVDGTKLPVEFYALPENEKRARKALPEFLDHLRQLEETCGPYPFRNEKYGIAETPHLGMEHQTIIAYGNQYRRTGFDYDWLHHHEMSHEWWGNLVTNRNWSDMWIHEGIGTYMQALYIERKLGAKAYKVEMQTKRASLVNRVAVAPRAPMDTQSIYFGGSGNDIYYKGSWICHTLRWVLGDETFFAVLRRWAYPDPAKEKVTDGSQCRFADTDELLAIAEKVSGQQLGWFFELYLRQPALPKLVSEERDGALSLRWETPEELAFPMPVPVEIGGKLQRVEMPDGAATVPLHGKAWRIDPDARLLMAGGRRGG